MVNTVNHAEKPKQVSRSQEEYEAGEHVNIVNIQQEANIAYT